MKSIWSIIPDYEGKYIIDPSRCRNIISQSKNINDVHNYVENVKLRLLHGDRQAIEEAWTVAVPLSYRLAIDDTSSGYRIASCLKDSALWLDQPATMLGIQEEIDWLCKSSYGIGFLELEEVRNEICDDLSVLAKTLRGNWIVYSRQKNISSILSKLTNLYLGKKLPKIHNQEILAQIKLLLYQFEDQVLKRISGKSFLPKPYEFSVLKWMIPDLLAFTLQLSDGGENTNNLGSAKARYKSVYRKFEMLPAKSYYGPSYSTAWHMNRMVSYIEYKLKNGSLICFEIFIRTDLDYFIGYGNYWRYKGVNLFNNSSRDNNTNRRKFVKEVRSCANFREVQTILFKGITTGQLELF